MGFGSASAMLWSAKTFLILFLLVVTVFAQPVSIAHRRGQFDTVKLHESKDAVSVEFETPCRQCFDDGESNVIFDIQIARTTSVCGESDVQLNDQKLAFTWDGANAVGDGMVTAQLAGRKEDVNLRLHWRSLCIASPRGSIGDYAAQILTFTFYPAGQEEGNDTSGFAVSFNSVDKPEILRLVTSPAPTFNEPSVLEEWLKASGNDRLHQESLVKSHPITDAELEEQLKELHKLRDQAKALDRVIKEKDEKIPDSPCRPVSKVRQNESEKGSKGKNSTDPYHIPHAVGSNNTSIIDSTQNSNTGWTEPPSTNSPPSNQLPSRSAIIKHVIRDFAFVSLFVAVLYMLLKHCGNSISCRRRRVDMLARREQRRTLHAYRAAACRYRLRQWWHRLLGREDMAPIAQSPTTPINGEQNDTIRISTLPPSSLTSESENDTMPNEILGLRRVFEFVGELVNPNGPPAVGDRVQPRLAAQDITEITARRYAAGTPAPSSTAPLTTIGSPRASTSILSFETDSEDTVDSLDPETATMMSG
ncbi:uncharacterized protein TERG_03710 [Trichophyton rubrum CBS 118892]|uniref:Uncharacterized protein n=1 Tax=Trichophyton rubrum (strain ATCC MYA-4607 / CBS 118892) TaxID=559305 RepID=F2SLN2_TRIRC|nr:uncharacterized protein TERG_03710 [Trichophyton rubrum CBS 118892]EGD87459.1 hypothetical protein TERG_03710 [Trichophyton rubrum CBS 118892]KMQ46941.1 hypothetical protein HL42_2421 [Trichophyton rubrum]